MKRSRPYQRGRWKNVKWIKEIFYYSLINLKIIFIYLLLASYSYINFTYDTIALISLVFLLTIYFKKWKSIFFLILGGIFFLLLFFIFPIFKEISKSDNSESFYFYEIKNKYAIVYSERGNKYIYYFDNNSFLQGDVIEAKSRFIDLKNPLNDSSFNFKNYLYSKHVYYEIKLTDIKIVNHIPLLKGYINQYLNTLNNENAKQMFGLFLFNTGDGKEITSIAKELGILHILIISGFHIHIIILIIRKLFNKLINNQWIINIVILLIVWFLTFLFNFSISTLRVALNFTFLSLLQNMKNKKLKSEAAFFLGGIIHLFTFPFIGSIITTFLSYGITYVISLFNRNYKFKGNSLIIFIKKYISIMFLANLCSLPLISLINYEYNVISLLVQMFISPLIISLYPLLLICFFIKESHNFIALVYNWLKVFLIVINISSFNLVFGKIPSWLVLIMTFNTYLFVINLNKRKFIYNIIFMIHLILLNTIVYFRNYLDIFYHIEFINVGNGLSILIRLPNNQGAFLFDAPSRYNLTNREVIPFIKSRAIQKLDGVFISHHDNDHSGGEKDLVKRGLIEESKVIKNKNRFLKFSFNNDFFINNLNHDFLDIWSDNNKSLVLEIYYKEISFLFTADMEKKIEDKLCKTNRKYNLILVPHHGSKTSSSTCFVNSITTPRAISSNNNGFGFPKPEIVQRWINNNSKFYSTLWSGNISFSFFKNLSYEFLFYNQKLFHI